MILGNVCIKTASGWLPEMDDRPTTWRHRGTTATLILALTAGLLAARSGVLEMQGADAAPIRVRKRISAEGVVRAVEPGWLTVENDHGQRARLKFQSKAAAGLLLEGTGVVVDFPCRLRIRGELPAAATPIGCPVRCVADMPRNQRTTSPIDRFQLQPRQPLGVRWHSAVQSRCEIVGIVVDAGDDWLLLHTEHGIVRVPLAPQAKCMVESSDPRWLRPGDRIEKLSAAKLSSSVWAVQAADVTLVDVARRSIPDSVLYVGAAQHRAARPPLGGNRKAGPKASISVGFPAAPAPVMLAVEPRFMRSEHLLVRTDLPEKQAARLIASLERICQMLGRHFGQAPKRPLRCIIVSEPKLWDPHEFEPAGWQKVLANAGVTVTERIGKEAHAIVYTAAKDKVVRHEVVHAFCAQTFGDTGPTWYAEGLAELGSYWEGNPARVVCDPVVTDFIRSSPPRTLASIVAERHGTGESWRAYAWRWAACQLLACNPNYAHRFSGYGKELMGGGALSFDEYWGSRAGQAAFEFRHFSRNVGVGYNHALCAWDWSTPFQRLRVNEAAAVTVHARKGWQATGCKVIAGSGYDFAARGLWRVDDYRGNVDADGWPRGEGRLVAAILTDDTSKSAAPQPAAPQLNAAFRLGSKGSFIAPQSGKLYVRCCDAWTQLDDNQGACKLHLRRRPLLGELMNPKRAGDSRLY